MTNKNMDCVLSQSFEFRLDILLFSICVFSRRRQGYFLQGQSSSPSNHLKRHNIIKWIFNNLKNFRLHILHEVSFPIISPKTSLSLILSFHLKSQYVPSPNIMFLQIVSLSTTIILIPFLLLFLYNLISNSIYRWLKPFSLTVK